jgi:hypothetical protein
MEHLDQDGEAFEVMIKSIKLQFVTPGVEVIMQGDPVSENDCMYFVERGEVDIYNKDSVKTQN